MKSITRILASALLLFSLASLFMGGITLKDKRDAKTLKGMMREVEDEFDDTLDDIEDAMEVYEDLLKEEGVKVSFKGLKKDFKSLFNALKDAKISPAELVFNTHLFVRVSDMAQKMNTKTLRLLSRDLADIAEAAKQIKPVLTAVKIFFWLMLLVDLLYIALHVMGKKIWGYLPAGLHLILWIVLGTTVSALNKNIGMKALKIGAAPVLAFFAALIAALLWSYVRPYSGKKKHRALGEIHIPEGSLSGSTSYAPEAGSSYTSQAGSPAPQAGTAYGSASPAEGKFCKECGARMSADGIFCPECGARQ